MLKIVLMWLTMQRLWRKTIWRPELNGWSWRSKIQSWKMISVMPVIVQGRLMDAIDDVWENHNRKYYC